MQKDEQDNVSLSTNRVVQKQHLTILQPKPDKLFSLNIRKQKIVKIIITVIAVVTFLLLARFIFRDNQTIQTVRMTYNNEEDEQQIQIVIDGHTSNDRLFKNDEQVNKGQFPRILWVHTQKQLNGQRMIEQVTAKNWIDWGNASNYEVRIVNNFNAYQWLSPQIIEIVKYTKQSSKYGTSAYQILKLALLIQHGGLYLKINNVLMIDKFPQINQHLESWLKDHEDETFLKKNSPEILLFYRQQQNRRVFADDVIYCKKNSRLMRDVMQKARIFWLNGEWPYKYQQGLESVASGSKVTYIHNIIYHTMNANYRYYHSHHSQFIHMYKVLSLNIANNSICRQIEKKQFYDDSVKDQSEFFKKYGNISVVVTKPVILWDILIETFYTSSIQWATENSVYANRIVRTQNNKWMLDYLELQRPKVQFCIISLKTLGQFGYEKQINQSINYLKKQQYTNWQAIYFAQNIQQPFLKYSTTPNVTIINSSLEEGLDFQRAVLFYCRPKSIAVVLNYDQYFNERNALTIANKQFTDVGMYGAFVAIQANGVIYQSKFGAQKIWRIMLQPNQQLYDDIANHFRFVSIQSYRFLSHGNLHDDEHGRYFNTVIPFLTMLQTFWDYGFCYKSELTYHIKKVNHYYQVPKFRLTLNSIVIVIPQRKKINIKTFQYFNKYPAYEFCKAIGQFLNYKKRPIQQFFILNNGVQFKGLKNRSNRDQIIPKKIHQVWVGGPMPKYKQFIMAKNREHHPDYEYYLWGDANITKENFPNSYYLIRRLLQFNKHSAYNKLSMVGDLMKHELLYNNGGFYLDANYMILRPHSLDNWRTFKAMYVSHYEPRQRLERYSGLIGCIKNFKNFERVINHTVIGSRDYYSHEASIEAGPFLLSEAIRGQEQNDLEIFQPSFDHIYPFAIPYKFLCEAPDNLPESQTLFRNKRTYYKNCSDIYYYAFGVDFFAQGLSWFHQKGK